MTSTTISCDAPVGGGAAGSASVSVNDADNSNSLTTGDTLTATFSNCYLSLDGTTINGGFSLTALTINGTPSVAGTPWNAVATFKFTNLKINDPSGNYTVNGAFSFSGATTDGVGISVSLNGASLTVQENAGPTLTLTNFKLDGTVDNNTTAYSEYGSGQVSDSVLGGYVNFQISSSTPFKGIAGQYPSSGSMTVTGANNSSVKLTTIDSTNVQLQVDTNGDGVVDSTTTQPWSAIVS